MKKANKQVRLHDLAGNGATIAQAKADLQAQISSLVEDIGRAPELVEVHGLHALVWRELYGWSYRLMQDDIGQFRAGPLYATSTGNGTRAEVIARATGHLADSAWSHSVEDDAAFLAAVNLTDEARAERLARYGWYRRVKAAMDAGASPEDARDIADGRVPGWQTVAV